MQSRFKRILYSTTLHAKGNITSVATRGTSRFSYAIGTVIFRSWVGAVSFSVSKRQQIAIRWDSARTPSRTRAPVPSIGFGLSPQLGQGHTQTLWCTKTDKIRNNCSSCRTHMAIVIVQKKSKWSPLYLDEFHQFRNELDLESLRNDKCNRINTEVAFSAQIVVYQCRCFF